MIAVKFAVFYITTNEKLPRKFSLYWNTILGLKCLKNTYFRLFLSCTDNRFTDEVHFKGGAVIASQMLSWSAIMFTWNARPPHPKLFAGEDWKKAWKERLENTAKPCTKVHLN